MNLRGSKGDPFKTTPSVSPPDLTLRQKVGGGVWEGNYRGNGEKRRGEEGGKGLIVGGVYVILSVI